MSKFSYSEEKFMGKKQSWEENVKYQVSFLKRKIHYPFKLIQLIE